MTQAMHCLLAQGLLHNSCTVICSIPCQMKRQSTNSRYMTCNSSPALEFMRVRLRPFVSRYVTNSARASNSDAVRRVDVVMAPVAGAAQAMLVLPSCMQPHEGATMSSKELKAQLQWQGRMMCTSLHERLQVYAVPDFAQSMTSRYQALLQVAFHRHFERIGGSADVPECGIDKLNKTT